MSDDDDNEDKEGWMDWCEKWGEYAGICATSARTSTKLNVTNDDDDDDKWWWVA